MNPKKQVKDLFELNDNVALITGGAGLLGYQHAKALLSCGAQCVLVDISEEALSQAVQALNAEYLGKVFTLCADITKESDVARCLKETLARFGSLDILVNNAAHNPKAETVTQNLSKSARFETFPLLQWQQDLDVGLKGAFLCTQIFGTHMAQAGGGIIVNIASDLALIAPDQRIYQQKGLPKHQQPTKPVTYSVVKAGLIGLTKYTATYWANNDVRCNALVPGGVYTGQDDAFVAKLSNLIPLSRMARADEYAAALVFLCSEASSYMTGTSLVIDGGRTCW